METQTKKIVHTCKECQETFNEYLYYENCKECNGEGSTWEYGTCLGCGGTGDHDEWVKDICEWCLRNRLQAQW